MLSEDQFMETYNPVRLEREGEYMLDTWDAAIEAAEARGMNKNHVWAIVYGDEDDALYAAPGFHHVNVQGFIMTETPWETGLEDAVWMEDDFEGEEEFDLGHCCNELMEGNPNA